MRIAVFSDIHDNLWNLRTVTGHVEADELICCGDLCSPFVMDQLAKFAGPVHIVFGNNDADLFRITRKGSARVQVYGEFLETELGGKRVAVTHFDSVARPVALSGLYDLVCYGHNHEFRVLRLGRTTAVNPGTIMGARFPAGQWTETVPTYAVYDTETGQVEAYEIAPGGTVRPHPFEIADRW